MKHFLSFAACAAVLAALTGCPNCVVSVTPVQSTYVSALGPIENLKVDATASVSIDSYLLFGCLPILTGNSYRPNSSTYKKFSDQATAERAESVFYSWGEGRGADRAVVLRKDVRSSGWWSLWLLWHKSASVEGEYLISTQPEE